MTINYDNFVSVLYIASSSKGYYLSREDNQFVVGSKKNLTTEDIANIAGKLLIMLMIKKNLG